LYTKYFYFNINIFTRALVSNVQSEVENAVASILPTGLMSETDAAKACATKVRTNPQKVTSKRKAPQIEPKSPK